ASADTPGLECPAMAGSTEAAIDALGLDELPSRVLRSAVTFMGVDARESCLGLLEEEAEWRLKLIFHPHERRLVGWCALQVRDLAGEGEWQDILYPLLEKHVNREIPADFTSGDAERAVELAAVQAEKRTQAGFAARSAYEAWTNRRAPDDEAVAAAIAMATPL